MTIEFRQKTLCPNCGHEHTADMPFARWMRSRTDLPSSIFVSSDCDFIVHRYKSEVDNIGTREFQHIGILEVKTFAKCVGASQLDTLMKLHARLYGDGDCKKHGDRIVRHWGVAIVRLEADTPDNGRVTWRHLQTTERVITVDQLVKLMRFDLHWTNLAANPMRRHHKTMEIIETVQTELGFQAEKPVIYRS